MRWYEKDGNKYPSVTTILKLISGNDDLMKWANYLGFRRKDLTKVLDESARFGTMIHSHLEAIVSNSPVDTIPPKDDLDKYSIDKCIANFNRTFKDIEYNTLFSEKTIISSILGYGGTMDWYVEMGGVNILMDFKTSKKPRPSMFLQLGAYYNLLLGEGYDVDLAAIILVNEKECSIHPISKEVLIVYGDLYNLLYKFYIEWTPLLHQPDYSLIDIIKNNEIIAKEI